jgi:tetratricopeptide (TPR) repeat protein
MSNERKRRRADPPAREAPSVDVDDDVSPGDVLRLVSARFDELEEKLERVREEHVETRAELTATRRTPAELIDIVKSVNPTFDVNEQLASVVFSHVTDVCTRVALSLVNSVWRKASKVASSQPLTLRFNIEMLEWYKKGALHGNTECEMIVGCVYYHGVLVKKDIDTASQYFEKVAAKGDAVAQNSVGCCLFEKGRYDESFKWFTKAAAQGIISADCNLGIAYEHGCGVTKDNPKALEMYTKAAEKGDDLAAKFLRKLTK